MKVNPISALILGAIGFATSYLLTLGYNDAAIANKAVVWVAITLFFIISFGIKFNDGGSIVNSRLVGGIFLGVTLALDLILLATVDSPVVMSVINGLLLLICFALLRSISRSKI